MGTLTGYVEEMANSADFSYSFKKSLESVILNSGGPNLVQKESEIFLRIIFVSITKWTEHTLTRMMTFSSLLNRTHPASILTSLVLL